MVFSLLLLAAIFVPSAAHAGSGMLGLYDDQAGTNCGISVVPVGIEQVFVVHSRFDQATAARFSAPKPACWANAIRVSDVTRWPISVGNSQTGVVVPYGVCETSTVFVMIIQYVVLAPPLQACCPYPVLPDPAASSGQIEIADCEDNVLFAAGAAAIVNPNTTCPCVSPPVPVEATAWGRVKSLYASE
jgi:hypothetical protein